MAMAASAADMYANKDPVAADATGLQHHHQQQQQQHQHQQQQQRQFKKHKVLPRPPPADGARDVFRRTPKTYNLDYNFNLAVDTAAPPAIPAGAAAAASPSSPQTLKHQLRRIGTGPDLPPTPPTHSRASSSSHSTIPSSPTTTEQSMQLPQPAAKRPPATPPDQRSPPTPDVTPPHPTSLSKALRPSLKQRGTSESTMLPDSRTESFKTAREEPISSEDETGLPARWGRSVSATSHTTVTQLFHATDARQPRDQISDSTMRRQNADVKEEKRELGKNSGKLGSASEVKRQRDTGLQGAVMGRKQQRQNKQQATESPQLNGHRDPVVEDELAVSPTDATKAVRSMSLKEPAVVHPSPKRRPDRRVTAPVREKPEPARKNDMRRSSSASAQSGSVVEVVLLDGPPRRQQRTLRHVRRQFDLRESVDAESSSADRVNLNKSPKPQKVAQSPQMDSFSRHESYISTTTNSSARPLSSRRARREIWNSGSIPVVIVPDRKSSRKSSREPSLRSTSSMRSKGTKSVGSASINSPALGTTPVFERPTRRSRAYSESDRSERTIDYPPVIPARSSSLSAPTSRNTSRAASRANSFTAGDVRVHVAPQHAALEQHVEPRFSQQVQIITPDTPDIPQPSPQLKPAAVEEPVPVATLASGLDMRGLEREETLDTIGSDRHDELLSPRKYSSRNTPFSVASMETCGTAPELSEALAVHMYPHQNSSVVMVDHLNRNPEVLDKQKRLSNPPEITMTNADGDVPVTPPQQKFTSVDVDSPLRNPRAPPQPPTQVPKYPPAINFIPATPSGMTPAAEKIVQQGNFFESQNEKPSRRPSLVRRAFSRRRHSIDHTPMTPKAPGFLARRFSLSRKSRDIEEFGDMEGNSMYPQAEDKPAEEDKLHPFWRPQWINDEDSDFDDDDDRHDDYRRDEVYRYPPVDNRPGAPARTLSQKLKKTFAILPTQEYHIDDMYGPQRRTIQRTPSGNLRVMRRKNSNESLKRGKNQSHSRSRSRSRTPTRKPRPIADGEPRKAFWRRSNSLNRGGSVKETRRFSLGSKLEEFQNIPHMISERRREKRTQQLRQMISGPTAVRDGVGEVIRCRNSSQNGQARQF